MKTKLVLFGKEIDVASRLRRRWLVAVFYSIFGVLLLWSWSMRSGGSGFLTIEFTLLVGPILGGYFSKGALFGRRGLIEPFKAQTVLKYPDSASILRPSTLLHPVVDDDPELRTDERALHRRDYAHYVSHGFLGTLIFDGFILEHSIYSDLDIGLGPNSVNRIVYYLLQVGYISSMTLPQAILLWTEPDMEAG